MSKRLLRLTHLVLIISFVFLFLPKSTLATEQCNITFNPEPQNQNMGELSITIFSNDLTRGTYVARGAGPTDALAFGAKSDIDFVTGRTSATTLRQPSTLSWPAGKYTVYIIEKSQQNTPISNVPKIALCQKSFNITDIPQQPNCTTDIETKPIDPTTKVTLVIHSISKDEYKIYVNNELAQTHTLSGDLRFDICRGDANISQNCEYSTGVYNVIIKKGDRLQCTPACFTVASKGSTGGGACTSGTITPVKKCEGPNCSKGGGDSCIANPDDGRGPAFKTAIGCIHTSPPEFVKDLMKFVIGIGGGLAFLMMLLGAYQMLSSAGNPETLKAGQDRLTSAVIGLLFIIFTILLLQIIGIGILAIPGFIK